VDRGAGRACLRTRVHSCSARECSIADRRVTAHGAY